MSAADLTSRVTALLGGEGGVPEADTLLADLGGDRAALEADRAQAHEQSVDVATTAASAAKLHAKATQLAFEVERLGRQETAVLERLVAIREAELKARARAEQAAALTERDQLASDLEEGYAQAVAAIVGLFDRLTASNARLRGLGLNPDHVGAEQMARGFVPNVGGKPGTLAGATRLVDLCRTDTQLLWPRPQGSTFVPYPTTTFSPPRPAQPAPAPLSLKGQMAQAEAAARQDARRFPIDNTPAGLPLG